MQVKLFKKLVPYVDKEGEEKVATNFFVECGDVLVPVEIKYFESKETGEDKNYRTRKTLLSAFAEELPERSQSKPKNNENKGKPTLEVIPEEQPETPFK